MALLAVITIQEAAIDAGDDQRQKIGQRLAARPALVDKTVDHRRQGLAQQRLDAARAAEKQHAPPASAARPSPVSHAASSPGGYHSSAPSGPLRASSACRTSSTTGAA